MTIYLKIDDNERIEDIKFQTFGCGSAIAVSSMITELAKGQSLGKAKQITNKDVAAALEGLPQNKLHCSNLGADALHKAIENYRQKPAAVEAAAAEKGAAKKSVACPYCEGPMEGFEQYCQACHVELSCCAECGEPLKDEADSCPHCGATKVRV